ncbi:MAG: TipAS antibiotic-recognition domain-containing protein [Gemmatimonadetes bacterium]|nr:TipAS antibiotic-recognition domain-containing protein [Gemmatimonadota bacterium]MBT8402909.1 TipAS antibiotic-recognition domain-containing protein [Gemmatimonadota bacterium]NNF39676.1 TipAS antibiotic-recognition domain-containing protein [Gemmatimonadota bacterium]
MHDENARPENARPENAAHAAEAEERWGDTEAWRESRRRTKRYSPREWDAIKAEGAANEASFATLLRTGARPTDEKAMDLAEAARRHIDRWFYECSPEMHVNLAGLYESDPRFRAHYDDHEPGLARFVAEAIRANALR